MRVIVLGAGPAGLAAADALVEAGARTVVIEAREGPGGLARSEHIGAHRADLGPHRWHHAASNRVRALFDAHADLVDRERRGAIHLGGRTLRYPLKPLRALFELGPVRTARYALSAALARVGAKSARSFAEEATRRVGGALFRELYAPSAMKIWGRAASMLDAAQARARVSKLGAKKEPGRYLYPSPGANGLAYEAWAKALAARGVVFHFGCEVTAVEHDRGRVTSVRMNGANGALLRADRVVSTLALPRLTEKLRPSTGVDAGTLSFRTLVMLYVVIARERVSDADVHYFPGEDVPFARMTEQRAFGATRDTPPNETVLAFDFYDEPGGRYVTATPEALMELALPVLARFGVARHEILMQELRVAPDAYPILERGFAVARDHALDALAKIEGLISTGRGGLFLHVNQHHAMEMGLLAAEAALMQQGSSRHWREAARAFECAEVAD